MVKQYGKKKGEQVFHASKNKGTITGVEKSGGGRTMPKKRTGAKRSIPRMPNAGGMKKPGNRTTTMTGGPANPRMRRATKQEVKASPAVKRNRKRRSAY